MSAYRSRILVNAQRSALFFKDQENQEHGGLVVMVTRKRLSRLKMLLACRSRQGHR